MWHKPCRTFHPWCLCIKTRCLFVFRCKAVTKPILSDCQLDCYGTNFDYVKLWNLNYTVIFFHEKWLKIYSAKHRPFCSDLNVLTHFGPDKTAAILQTTFSSACSWMKFNSNCTELCSRESHWYHVIIGSDYGLVLNRQQAISWTRDEPLLPYLRVSARKT